MRYFFQWMILITMAVSLAACGGSSGSKGDTGAAGAQGAQGAQGDQGDPGSIAVPSADSDLDIVAGNSNDTIDNDTQLGEVTLAKKITGLDNTTAMDSRLRYYVYEGTSATDKVAVFGDGNASTLTFGSNGVEGSDGTGVIDPREMTTDNMTFDTASYVLSKTDGSITHMIVCPGNEAGDATTCASEALNDRGSGQAKIVTSGEGSAAAAKFFAVMPYSTANFVSLRDNTSDVRVYDITDTKTSGGAPAYGTTIAITDGATGSGLMKSANAGTLIGGSGTGHSVDAIESNGVYYYSTVNGASTDNVSGAIYKYTTSASTHLDNITAANSSAGVGNNIVLAGTDASANDTIFAVANHIGDNKTASAYRISVGDATPASTLWGTDNLTLSGDNATRYNSQVSLCADARYMSATGANTRDASTDNATLFIGYRSDNLSWVIDSLSTGGGSWSTGIYTAASSDNTSEAYCSMTVTKHGNDNGTLYMAAKTNTTVYTIYKLTGLNSLSQANLSTLGTVTVGAAGPVDIGFDTDDNSTVVVVNDAGNIELFRNNEVAVGTFTAIGADSTGVAGDRVSLAVQPSKYAVGYMDSNDNASIRIFYDE